MLPRVLGTEPLVSGVLARACKGAKIFQDVGLKSAVLLDPGLHFSSHCVFAWLADCLGGVFLSLRRAQATFRQLNREEMIPWMRHDSTSRGPPVGPRPPFVVLKG